MLESDINHRYSSFMSVSSISLFSQRDVRKEARRQGFYTMFHGEKCYVVKFLDSVVPAGPYTPAAITASERENGQCDAKINRYQGHRIRIEDYFEKQNFSYILTGKVEREDGNVLFLANVCVFRNNELEPLDEVKKYRFVKTAETTISILD